MLGVPQAFGAHGVRRWTGEFVAPLESAACAAVMSEGSLVSPAADRIRVLVGAALWPLLTAYAAIAAVLAIVTAFAAESQFSAEAALLGAGPGWLAAYQVPISIDSQPLGLLP